MTTLSYPERERLLALLAVKSADAFHTAVSAGVQDDHFTVMVAGAVWTAVRELREAGKNVTGVEMVEKLRPSRHFDDARALLKGVPTLEVAGEAEVYEHAAKIVAASQARTAAAEAADALRELQGAPDPQAALGVFLDRAFGLTMDQQRTSRQMTTTEALSSVFNKIVDKAARRRTVTGIPTGIMALDEHTRGLQAGKVTVLGARPGVGKTAFATSMTAKLIESHDEARAPMPAALFYSMEMDSPELCVRLMAEISKVDINTMMFGEMPSPDTLRRMQRAADLINKAPLTIDDKSSQTVEQLAAGMWRWVRRMYPKGRPKGAYGVVIIDYLTRIKKTRPSMSLQEHVMHCMAVLADVAKDTGLAVLVLSQLTRLHLNEGRWPDMGDLKGGGEIEENAFAVVVLHPLGRAEDAAAGRPWRNLIAAQLEKNRAGEPGKTVMLHYEGSIYDFRAWNTATDGNYDDVIGQSQVQRGKPAPAPRKPAKDPKQPPHQAPRSGGPSTVMPAYKDVDG